MAPNREPQEYSGNIVRISSAGSSYIPIMLVPCSWGSLFEIPINVLFRRSTISDQLGFLTRLGGKNSTDNQVALKFPEGILSGKPT